MTVKQLCLAFKGRINRRIYWIYTAGSLLILLFPSLLLNDSEDSDSIFWDLILGSVGGLTIYIDIAVSVKRLHDTGRSGWHLLLGFVPIIGTIYLLVVCGFIKGTEGINDYGPPADKITLRQADQT